MLDHLKNEFNKTRTVNGALAYNSTESDVLDLFALGGAYRNHSDLEVAQLFSKAFSENPLLAMKTLFWIRDVREGQGERRFFKVAIKHLALHNPEALKKNLHLIPEFGRWDDMWLLLDTRLKDDVARLVKRQLVKDKDESYPSNLAKWLPSENASSPTTKRYAKIFAKSLGATPREYRKLLTLLRKRADVLEIKLTEKNYKDIDYSKLPSKAGMKYRQAFWRNDEERYEEFLDSLSKGEVTVNSGTLYPSDIVGKILNKVGSYYHTDVSEQDVKLFEGQWNNLPDFIGDKTDNSMVMADVSGSMYGKPLDVSISLAMYIAERNKGAYKDHFMTFSSNPQLVKIKGSNIVEKVENISDANWDMSTDIERALRKILKVAVENNVPKEDMIAKLIIVSDMNFDQAQRGGQHNIFKVVSEEFENHGFIFPNIVFWNVNASSNVPATMNENGVTLVSGYSPSIMQQIVDNNGKTAYEFMLDVIGSDRYSEIAV